ncbi:MAG: hypothetical protein ACLVJK_06075 [Alistipes putredinis]
MADIPEKRFRAPYFAAHPEIAAAKAALLDAGAVYAAMSGSGSAVFGLFDDEEKARSRKLHAFCLSLVNTTLPFCCRFIDGCTL